MTLSLIAYEPLSQSNRLYGRDFIDDLTTNHQGYNHTISAVGGFNTASFRLGGTRDYLADWFVDGILRRIVMYSPEGIPVWEGYVHSLEITGGSIRKTKSIEQFFNRVYVHYSPLDTSFNPPLEQPLMTLTFDDLNSQADFGIKSVVLSGGGREDITAFNWGRAVLRDSREFKVGESVNTQSGDIYSLKVDCKGYFHTLKWLPYVRNCSSRAAFHSMDSIASTPTASTKPNISDLTGQIQGHQVIQEVLTYFNNTNPGLISQDFGLMDYNFAIMRRCYGDYDKSCWDVIEKEVIDQGGTGGERWVGGVYQFREFTYKQAEALDGLYADEFELYRSLEDPGQLIFDAATGAEVKPWDMLPDRVLHTVDVNPGGHRDLMYIEQVKFTEPYGLELVGGDDRRLQIFLAQRGLPGL